MDDDAPGEPSEVFDVQLYGLCAVVYTERDDRILLLKRAGARHLRSSFDPDGIAAAAITPPYAAASVIRLP